MSPNRISITSVATFARFELLAWPTQQECLARFICPVAVLATSMFATLHRALTTQARIKNSRGLATFPLNVIHRPYVPRTGTYTSPPGPDLGLKLIPDLSTKRSLFTRKPIEISGPNSDFQQFV